jgi:hypothetical protein
MKQTPTLKLELIEDADVITADTYNRNFEKIDKRFSEIGLLLAVAVILPSLLEVFLKAKQMLQASQGQ